MVAVAEVTGTLVLVGGEMAAMEESHLDSMAGIDPSSIDHRIRRGEEYVETTIVSAFFGVHLHTLIPIQIMVIAHEVPIASILTVTMRLSLRS